MAAGDSILRTWIDNVWNKFNTVISSFSNGLSQLSAPTSKIAASDIAALNNKINQIKADYYLSSEANLFVTFSAVQGSVVPNTFKNAVDNNLAGASNFSIFKCKNVATYLNGTKTTNGTCSNESCLNGSCGRGTYSYGQTRNSRSGYSRNSTAKSGRGSNSNGTCDNGNNSNGTCSNGTNSNGTNSHGTVVQLRNSNTTIG